jgi:hypothetical protein
MMPAMPIHAREISFEHDGVRDGVDRRSAVLLGHEDPEQSHRLHLLDDLCRVATLQLPVARDGRDAAAGELADQRPELRLLWRQLKVHRQRGPARITGRPRE